jgi:hypothetical protein
MTDDFNDDILRSAIGSRSGGPVHTGTARQAVIARAERTRTMRSGAIVGTTGLVVVAGLLLLPNIGDTQPQQTDQPAAPTVDSIAAPPTTTNPPTDTASPTPSTTRPTETTATTTPDTSSPAVPATTTPSTPSISTLAPTATTAALDPSDPPFTQQYESTGGSITVTWNGTALILVSANPATGYVTEIEDQSADRLRVRFRSDSNDSRIEVRVRDGRVEHTIS